MQELFDAFQSELLGNNCFRKGMPKAPNVTHTLGTPNNALAKALKIHFSGAFLKFLEFLVSYRKSAILEQKRPIAA